MFRVDSTSYTIICAVGDLLLVYKDLALHAEFHNDFGIKSTSGTSPVVSVGTSSFDLPELAISQRFDPGPESGFFPGALLVEETHR